MNIKLLKQGLAATAAVLVAAASPAFAQSVDLGAADAAISTDAKSLGAAKRASAKASVAAFLSAKGLDAATTASLVETNQFADKQGRRFARYEQVVNGLRVHGAYVKAAFDAAGAPVHMIDRLAPAGGRAAKATLGEAEALRIAIDRNFAGQAIPGGGSKAGAVTTFGKTAFFYRSPTVERVLIARGRGLEEGFLVETWSQSDNKLYHTLVDSLGRVASNELRTAEDSYKIFADHPGVSAQTTVAGPGAGNAQSPSGWLGTVTQRSVNIQGNNVNAYLDRDNNGAADAGGVTVSDGNFVSTANLTQAPTTTENQAVAIQNLFYLNNVTHDRLYTHGFTESQGNFQENNFGRGGLGSDSVNAEGQDGGSTNNANFSTPSDGSNPRMQMYLWTVTSPNRDGDLDSDIVYHEYGHGLSWRMIGGMSGDVAGAIGEGMSDVVAILFNNNDVVGEYSFNNAAGIRSSRYSTHPDTLRNFARSRGVHRNGEIYAATIWDVYEEYQAAGLTANDLMNDIVGGTNFTPSTPTYIAMRDGILAHTSSARDCLVWRGFARRGMGVGATMNSRGRVTESFTLPTGC